MWPDWPVVSHSLRRSASWAKAVGFFCAMMVLALAAFGVFLGCLYLQTEKHPAVGAICLAVTAVGSLCVATSATYDAVRLTPF